MLTALLVIAVLVLLLPAREAAVRAWRIVGAVIFFALAVGVVPRWLHGIEELHSPLRGFLDGREIVVDSWGSKTGAGSTASRAAAATSSSRSPGFCTPRKAEHTS